MPTLLHQKQVWPAGRTAALMLLLCSICPAPLVAPPDLAAAVREADDVVVARIASGRVRASGSEVTNDVTLQVTRVLKGSAVPGARIDCVLQGRGYFLAPTPTAADAPPVYGIWFLKKAEGRYAIIPRRPGSGDLPEAVVAIPDEAPPGSTDRDAALTVGNQLVAALRWLAARHGGELKPTVTAQRDGDRWVPSVCLGLFASQAYGLAEDLESLPDTTKRGLYRNLAREASPHLRAIGIAGLIAANDPEGPKLASAELSELAVSANVQPIIQNLNFYHNPEDGEAVRAIAALATADLHLPFLEESASYALRALHTRETMPVLVSLLDSTESSVRGNALAGICLFVRSAPVATPDAVKTMSWMSSGPSTPFRTAETDRFCWLGGAPEEAMRLNGHVAFWKSWWAEHGSSVMRP